MTQQKNLVRGGNGETNWSAELNLANNQIAIQNKEKEKRAEAMVIANAELRFQQKEKRERAAEWARSGLIQQRETVVLFILLWPI